jgi:cob(I)alamin adenosyltransferase
LVRLTKIYTKTGDEGLTGLVGGERVTKTDPRIEAIGAVDELNASIGLVLACDLPTLITKALGRIQNDLFDLGADLATPGEVDGALRLDPGQTAWLERQIDDLNKGLPTLTSFLLPSGSASLAHLHFARTMARRAERRVWALIAHLANEKPENAKLNPALGQYLNRLSDYLFVAARRLAHDSGREVLWQPGQNR